MATTRNYTSLYSIKDFAINELAPKYFNKDNVNDLNIGLLGYVTELIGSTTEDSFNTTTTYINEMFPHLAVLPETIYNWGSLFQLNTSFGTPAECDIIILIPEDEIIKNGVKVKEDLTSTISDNMYEFVIDSETVIDVEGIQFMPDYDVKINYRPYKDDYIFTARFNTERFGNVYKNTISNIINPYIVIKRINYEGVKYLTLRVKCHQVTKFTMDETIITNDSINASLFEIEFDDKLAGINVFYKAPGSINYVQMEARMTGTAPLKIPFYYYKRTDDRRLIISFSTRDNYFQPKYNSDIRIEYYTTVGSKGNFPEYTGNNVVITPTSETYPYNSNITLIGFPITSSMNGKDESTLSELQETVIKNFSTVNSFNTESDLQQYFSSLNQDTHSDCNILVIKKRDDIFERLFTLFLLCRNSMSDIYHTNTLIVNHNKDDYDIELSQSNINIIKPGHIYVYNGDSLDTAIMLKDETIETAKNLKDEFVYVNPFLIYYSKSPSILGYYLNTVDETYILDYTNVNESSLVQFICNSIHVKRDAILGENNYTITVNMTPTISTLETPIVSEEQDPLTGETTVKVHDNLKVKLAIEENGEDVAYINLELDSWDLDNNIFTFAGKLNTDDQITRNSKMKITNLISTETNEIMASKMISMDNCIFNIYTYYRYDENTTNYTYTNTYSTKSFPVTLIMPLQLMRSTTSYIPVSTPAEICKGDGKFNGEYYTRIQSYPLIALDILDNPNITKEFYTMFKKQYRLANEIVHRLTNNFSMDMKFVNTYGRSKNFTIGDDGALLLNKVNIKLHIQIKSVYGTNEEDLFRDVRIFIKDYVETINLSSGNNSIYISNLIQALENKFADLSYMKFISINDYDSSIQVIDNKTITLDSLTKEERINYVPEYLTIGSSDIIIDSI